MTLEELVNQHHTQLNENDLYILVTFNKMGYRHH